VYKYEFRFRGYRRCGVPLGGRERSGPLGAQVMGAALFCLVTGNRNRNNRVNPQV